MNADFWYWLHIFPNYGRNQSQFHFYWAGSVRRIKWISTDKALIIINTTKISYISKWINKYGKLHSMHIFSNTYFRRCSCSFKNSSVLLLFTPDPLLYDLEQNRENLRTFVADSRTFFGRHCKKKKKKIKWLTLVISKVDKLSLSIVSN